jgi:multiple antibiotic resistance protein
LAVGFVFLGQAIFRLLGIALGDFLIAGGTILFCLAMIDILSPAPDARRPSADLGAVPLGTPLIAGPAVLTTSLAIIEEYGLWDHQPAVGGHRRDADPQGDRGSAGAPVGS